MTKNDFLYDSEANASYLQVCSCSITSCLEVNSFIILDLAEDSHVIGVEVLCMVDDILAQRVENLLQIHSMPTIMHKVDPK